MPSRVIRAFAYDAAARALDVRFTSGRGYRFHDVPPEAAAALGRAFSKGRHFNARIRGRYRFTELPAEAESA